MDRYILGVHSGHDSSACLYKNNQLLYAIARERLTRNKHDSGEPIECIEYLLKAAGITYNQISLVVRVNWYDSTEINDDYYKKFSKVIVRYEHHLFHAYAASLAAKFDKTLIYIMDGRGCRPVDNGCSSLSEEDLFEAESLYLLDNGEITELQAEKKYAVHESASKHKYKWGSHMDSIGYAYADVSRLIFKDYNAAGKVMALAAYGVGNADVPECLYFDKKLHVRKEWLDYLNSQDYPLSYELQTAKNIACALQFELESYIQTRIKYFSEKYNVLDFCFSGGVALNCLNNGKLINSGLINSLGLFPASGDDGISIGAGLWAIRKIFKDKSKIEWDYALGKSYGEICYDESVLFQVIKDIHDDKIIGLFEGGSEYGPRALCNRSIIASAKSKNMKDRLNLQIKHRENFRPFGGVILERNLKKITDDRIASPLMLSAINIKPEMIDYMPALVHKDNTVRIQVIYENQNKKLIWKILDYLEKKYGELVLINTSFNGKGEPIVESQSDALLSAKRMKLEYVYMNGEKVDII